MKHPTLILPTLIHPFLALVALLGAAHAQAPEPEPSPARPQKPTPLPIRPPQDDTQRQMIELFGKVERELRAIDRLLQEAARPPSSGSSSTLAEDLRRAQTAGESVRQDIEKILELAASQQQNPSSGSSQPGQPQSGQSGSPLDNQGEQTTSREQTPSTPESGGAEPRPGDGKAEQPGEKPGEKPGEGQKPEGQGRERADGPQASKDDPQQNPSGDPAGAARGAANPARDGRDRWGDLPVHAREVFRNEGGKDMPPLYRDWIDAYYKRLNRTP